ncbi:hypothetical protein MXD81_54855, partial [Microbacteriaceae bacterium K1510]|nr:hypothetical protein [Microbacteriaceae bacterium K1510]
MNKADCGWREEEVIDFVMGKLTGEKADLFGQHIVQCEHCSALYREWTPLLTETPAPALPTVSAPSPALKKRLLRRIVLDSWLSSLVRRLRSIYTVPATVAVVLLL